MLVSRSAPFTGHALTPDKPDSEIAWPMCAAGVAAAVRAEYVPMDAARLCRDNGTILKEFSFDECSENPELHGLPRSRLQQVAHSPYSVFTGLCKASLRLSWCYVSCYVHCCGSAFTSAFVLLQQSHAQKRPALSVALNRNTWIVLCSQSPCL